MKKKVIIWSVIFLVIAGVIGIRVVTKDKSKYTKIKSTTVKRGDVKSFLSTSGDVESKNSKSYYGTQAKVTKINVSVGKTVKKGEILVNYDTPDLNLMVKQAQLQYDNAVYQKNDLINQKNKINKNIQDLNNQITELEKIQSLKAEELKTKRDSVQTISDEKIKQAENAIQLAKLSLDSAKDKLNKSKDKIVAENEGIVTQVNLKEGAMDNGMQPIIVVQDINNLKIKASVGKYDAKKIKLGQKVIIKNGEEELEGKVSSIEPAAKKITSPTGVETLLNLEIDIIGKSSQLRIGFDVDADILIGEMKNVLKIPAECIKRDKKGNHSVYIVKDGKAIEQKVKLGLQSDTEAEVVSGLKEKEKVIINPGATISNGVLVKEN